MHPNKTDKGFGFVIIYELLLNVSDFAVPHPTRLTPGHLPPGGRYFPVPLARYITIYLFAVLNRSPKGKQ